MKFKTCIGPCIINQDVPSPLNYMHITDNPIVCFWQIWDFPGQIDFFDPAFDSEVLFGHCGALVFVIDAQVHVCLHAYEIDSK